MRVCVKGKLVQAVAKAQAYNLPVLKAVQTKTGEQTWLIIEDVYQNTVARWFCEYRTDPPFPNGSCLYYSIGDKEYE